ncbi:MAG: hypothetical protein ACE5HC_16320 [Candidatus Binatia bacterium]
MGRVALWSNSGVFELTIDSKPRGEQAKEGLRWHELPKQDGQVHWLWDRAVGRGRALGS